MAPTSRVPGFGPRLELGLAGLSSAGQGIDRAEVKSDPACFGVSWSLPGFSRVGFRRWRTVNLMSEVLK